MGDTLTWDLVARDKSIEATLNRLSRSVDGLADHMSKAGRKSSDAMDDMAKKAKKSADEMSGSFGDAFSELAGRVDGPIGDLLGSIEDGVSSFKGGALAAGALIGGTLIAGVMGAVEQQKIGADIASKIGEGGAEAGRLGSLAGDIYADNFGDSLDQVGEAVTAVFQNKLVDTDAADADIKHMAESAITASQVVGDSANNIGRAARQLMVNDLAGSAQEAMDIIVHASQQGLNVNDDLIDTIIEYGGQFDRLGLKGPEAMGLISQALEGGARDADYAADALKEFAIRAQDGSASTARGFRAIGMDAGAMGQAIAAGGNAARGALDSTLDGLRAIEDPVLRNQTAVDLFGTKAEDLGDALYDLNLDTAAKAFGDFAGASDKATKVIGDAAPVWETMGRNITHLITGLVDTQQVVDSMNEALPPMLKEVAAAQREFDSSGDTRMLDEMREKYPEVADRIDAYIKKKQQETGAVSRTDSATQAYVETLDDLIKKNEQLAGDALSLFDANTNLAKSWGDLTQGLKDNGLTLDENTAKGQANRDNLSSWVDDILSTVSAMETQGAGTAEVTGFIERQREAYLDHIEALGGDRAAAKRLLDQLKLIPGNYKANVIANTAGAWRKLTDLEGYINFVTRERMLNIRYNINGNQMAAAGLPTGGHHIPGLASGGPVEAGKRYVVGEEGPELFVSADDGYIVPNDVFMSGSAAVRPPTGGVTSQPGGGSSRGGYATVTFAGDLDGVMSTAFMKLVRKGDIRIEAN